MYKTYAVMFMNLENRKIIHDTFYCRNESEATYAFRECWRHDHYAILAIAEVPEVQGGEHE